MGIREAIIRNEENENIGPSRHTVQPGVVLEDDLFFVAGL